MQVQGLIDGPIDHPTPSIKPQEPTHTHPNTPNPKPAYGQAGRLGQHRAQARFLALALVGLGSWLFCFSLVGFPAATVKDFAESTEYIDDVRTLGWVDYCWMWRWMDTPESSSHNHPITH